MFTKSVLSIIGATCTVVGAGASIGSYFVDKKSTEFEIEEKVNEAVDRHFREAEEES
jgi:hypothetical protein